MTRTQGFTVRRAAALAVALLSTLPFGPAQVAAQPSFCGQNSPAYPVPEFRGGARLWPSNGFHPAKPGQQLPGSRDTSQYNTQIFPSAANGLELFWALDVVGDRAFVMYNVGLSAWSLAGANAENPQMLDYRDGLAGHWFFHDLHGEPDGVLTDIAAIQDPSDANQIFVAVSSLNPNGATIWRFNRATGRLSQSYQNTSLSSFDVEMIAFGGRVYAFFASTSSAPYVIDVSQTNTLAAGCIDAACPSGIYLGTVGTAERSQYLGATTRGGKLYLALAYGGISVNSPKPEIWEIADPAHPEQAVRRFRGSEQETASPILFAKDGSYYLGVVESRHVKIYNVSQCLDADGCAALPSPNFIHALRSQRFTLDFLSYSLSEGTPFLYYGFEGAQPSGAAYERLFDLSNLGGSNVLPEMTATGETYTDPCNGQTDIGYWSDYYIYNNHGLRNFVPHKGKFSGKYFYRVTTATFDVHVREVSVIPAMTTSVASPGPYYFGEAVAFSAEAQNCAGPETWTWLASDAGATGLGVGSSSATIQWSLCSSAHCPAKNIEVWALKAACAGSPGLVLNHATITVEDPRLFADGFESGDTSAWAN